MASIPGFILGVAFLGLLLGPVPLALSLSETPAPQTLVPQNSRINRAVPGAKTGMLKMMTDTAAEIDSTTYPLAREIIVETQTGSWLSVSPGWQKKLRYPVLVQYWLGKTGIRQMIVFVPDSKSH